ncbi:MAG: hypothetical protein LBR26_16180 [Prevotella sp.]|jgi:hypothetical protein|nr:hypothetical protein [Prevotella sp.]
MKLVVLYGLIIGVFLCFGSCKNTDDEFQPDDVLPSVPKGYIRMQITVPGLTPVSTYALGTVDETHVSTVGVLVFKDGPDANDDTYLCYAAVTEPSKIIGTGSTKTFDVDLRAAGNITDAYVMVVANVSVDTTGFAASRPTKETVMREKMTFPSSGKWNVTGSSNFTPFPMWGMTASPVSLAGTNSISSISLIRSVARIDVGLKFPDNVTDGTENAAGLGSTFTLEEVYLYNSLDKGSIAPHSGNYSGTTVTAPSIPTPAPGTNNSPVPSYLSSNGTADGFSANKFSCTGAIYMAEHAAGTDALSDNPCLVIGGKYNGSGTVTYYRLDFVSGNYPGQTFLSVLRNHRYRFNITGVAGPGYTSADLAAAARPVNLTYALSATDEALTSYDYNGQYALGVSQDSYTFDKDSKSGNSLKISATFGKYSVEINPVTPTNNIDWLTGVTGAGDNVAAFGELTFNVSANSSGGERSAKIVITSGLLTKEVTVVQTNKVGFEVTGIPVTDPTYSSGLGSSKAWTVTSSYDWCVNVSDSHGIIRTFLAKGTSSTTSFTFTPLASTYYAKTEATFTFFSPTGEFDPVTKTISVPATSGQYLPSSHGGWAGSNIYWDGSRLTFDDTNNRTNEAYQGVFFKWGSLYGLDPSYTSQGSTSWGSSCRVYVPNWNHTNPTSSTWTNTTVGSTYTWTAIPYAEGQTGATDQKFAYLTMDAGATATANTSVGGHVPVKGKSVANQKMIGDICRYLTETGRAPGSPGVRWRMPTAAEFASPTTASPAIAATTDYALAGTFSGSGLTTTVNDATGKWIVTSSTNHPGRRKQYSHIWTAGSAASQLAAADQPFFPAGGYRENGGLLNAGCHGSLWSSSPGGNSNAYYLNFPIGDVIPAFNYDRTLGFVVRCVKEL